MTRKTTGSTTFEPVRTYADMIDDGWLTPVSFYTPEIPLAVSLWPEAVAQYLKHAAGKKALVFCNNQQQAVDALRHFMEAGIAAAALLGTDTPKQRTAALKGFESGTYQVLISVTLALDLGKDPSVEVVIMAAPTFSKARFEVMVAAAMRPQFAEGMTPAEADHRRASIGVSGKPKAMVFDFAGNCQRMGLESFTRRTPKPDTHLTIPGSLEWDQVPEAADLANATVAVPREWLNAVALLHMPLDELQEQAVEFLCEPCDEPRPALDCSPGGAGEIAKLRTQLALLNPARIDTCKECGSKSLSWFANNTTGFTGIQQGRLNTNDVTCEFVLGCDDCSETLRVVKADTIAARLNADTQHAKDAEQ